MSPASEPIERPKLIVPLLSLAAFCAYLTRVCISTSATTIQNELSLSNEQMGSLFAAFSLGYFLFQAPGGWLGNRFGARPVLAALSGAWSLFTLCSGLAHSLATLYVARLGFGLSQAGLVPVASKVLSDWIPDEERGRATAVLTSSMSVGAVLASGLTGILLPVTGWRPLFAMYSLVGLLWSAVFYRVYRDKPSPAASAKAASAPVSVAAVVFCGSLWAICAQSFFRAFGYAFFVTWFPAYLQKAHNLRVDQAGLLTMLPLGASVGGSLLGGFLLDVILRRTGSKWLSRSATAAAALFLCGVACGAAVWARGPVEAVIVIALGSFFMGVAGPCSWAGTMDIGGIHTPLVFAVMNMTGVLGDIASPVSVGYLFSHIEAGLGSWDLILYLFAGIYAAGALSWALFNPNQIVPGGKP